MENYKIIFAIVILVFLVLGVGGYLLNKNNRGNSKIKKESDSVLQDDDKIDKNNGNSSDLMEQKHTKTYSTLPPKIVESGKVYYVTLKTTEGDIKIELNTKDTPVTANNFYYLAKDGFYNNTIFHRVIDGFMVQGGDPRGDGTGGPGYKFDDEDFDGEYKRGVVAMANSGPDTNGSQFFIMHQDYPLPKNYVIFGKVQDGMDVVDTIATSETTVGASGEDSKPIEPVVINEVTVEEI